ncbi:MAG: hypothetical protein KA436_04145 [Oligoflexales bacterium]|nr:hypothetical protein [Oligoflexales bacterium]
MILFSTKNSNLFRLFFIWLFITISSNSFAVITQMTEPWLRLQYSMKTMRMDPKGRHLAFTDSLNSGLYVLDLRTRSVYQASSSSSIGKDYFWAPSGSYLFFKERKYAGKKKFLSTIYSYLSSEKKKYPLKTHSGLISSLLFNESEKSLHYMDEAGKIYTQRIFATHKEIQDSKSQKQAANHQGEWLMMNGQVYSLDRQNHVKKLAWDNDRSVSSYDLSKQGDRLVVSTQTGKIYVVFQGQEPKFIDFGQNPQWHPTNQNLLLYSGARRLGKVVYGYDLKIKDLDGESRWLTNTPHSQEQSPQWLSLSNRIVYTIDRTTDLFVMGFKSDGFK